MTLSWFKDSPLQCYKNCWITKSRLTDSRLRNQLKKVKLEYSFVLLKLSHFVKLSDFDWYELSKVDLC